MTLKTFQKMGDISTVREKILSPDVAVSESVNGSLRDAEDELMNIIGLSQGENTEWISGRFEALHQDPALRAVDTMLVKEDGNVLLGPNGSYLWASIHSYLGYPEARQLPKIDELLSMVLQRGELLYPLIPRRSVLFFCRESELDLAKRISDGDIEYFPYGEKQRRPIGFARSSPDYVMGYVPDGALKPKKIKEAGVALGDFGIWAISEKYTDPEHGDPDKIVGYRPRIYMSHGRHPAGNIYITPNPRARTIATGHSPMDERTDAIRIEMDPDEQDVIKSIFTGYMKYFHSDTIPLLLRHRRYTPWTGFYPKHGGSENSDPKL